MSAFLLLLDFIENLGQEHGGKTTKDDPALVKPPALQRDHPEIELAAVHGNLDYRPSAQADCTLQ